MHTTRFVWIAICFALICCVAMPVTVLGSVIPVGQEDDFQNGSLNNWLGGGGGQGFNSQTIVSTGGPSGSGDEYLQVSSGGNNSGPRLLAVNDSQWLGDFSNITAVSVELMNPVSNGINLSMRLAIREGTNNNSPGYVSTIAYNLPDDGQWHQVNFLLDAADMTAVSAGSPAVAPQPFATDKANVLDFRILDATNAVLIGDAFASNGPQVSFGVDDITAVPEPTSLVLFALAGSALLILKRRALI